MTIGIKAIALPVLGNTFGAFDFVSVAQFIVLFLLLFDIVEG